MTKKDYILIGNGIWQSIPSQFSGTLSNYYLTKATEKEKEMLDRLVDYFAIALKADNPRFDENKFRDYVWAGSNE